MRRRLAGKAAVTFRYLLYSRMNMNRNPRNPLKTNDRCTFYSRINRVFPLIQSSFQPPVARTLLSVLLRRSVKQTARPRSLRKPVFTSWVFRSVWAAVAIFLCALPLLRPAAAQTSAQPSLHGDLWNDLKDFVETPSVSGYENELSEKIRVRLAAFHPKVDNLGDVVVTIGSGSPRRLIVTPIDEPGFVVSAITPEGYLRLQRLPQSGLPPIYNSLYSAQPVKVRTASGKWIDGVVAGISVHLHRANETLPLSSDIENMYVDIGADSAEEARKAGVDNLSPVAINREIQFPGGEERDERPAFRQHCRRVEAGRRRPFRPPSLCEGSDQDPGGRNAVA